MDSRLYIPPPPGPAFRAEYRPVVPGLLAPSPIEPTDGLPRRRMQPRLVSTSVTIADVGEDGFAKLSVAHRPARASISSGTEEETAHRILGRGQADRLGPA